LQNCHFYSIVLGVKKKETHQFEGMAVICAAQVYF